MEKISIIIRDDKTKARAVSIINGLKLEPPAQVIIKEYKRNRSLEQNALYWKWLTVIGAELGMTKEETHEQMKRRFLRVIFMRDDEGFLEMILAIRKVHDDIAEPLKREVIKLMSTTQASVKQMSEYLDDINNFAAGLDIRLPAPEERG